MLELETSPDFKYHSKPLFCAVHTKYIKISIWIIIFALLAPHIFELLFKTPSIFNSCWIVVKVVLELILASIKVFFLKKQTLFTCSFYQHLLQAFFNDVFLANHVSDIAETLSFCRFFSNLINLSKIWHFATLKVTISYTK